MSHRPRKRETSASATKPTRVPVATFKAHLSRYLRDVEQHGKPISITMHGHDIAVLSPAVTHPAPLQVRPRRDERALRQLLAALKPLPDQERISERAYRNALDWTRGDRD